MKEKIANFTFCLLCFFSMIIILANNLEVAKVIIQASELFFTRVFVSLFPMFIINDLLINLNFAYFFYRLFNHLFKVLFKTSGIAAYVIIMSMLSGTPSNAYILKAFVQEKKLSVAEANHFLQFTYFSNPLFLINMLSVMFDFQTTIKIILIHYFSNIMIGILLRKKAPSITFHALHHTTQNIGSTLALSIQKSISTLLIILGTIVFYMLLTYIATTIFPLPYFIKTILAGFLEITNGLNLLTTLKIANKLKEMIAIAIISFGGLSIHTQIKAILEDTELDYHYFLKGRILQVILSVLFVFIF